VTSSVGSRSTDDQVAALANFEILSTAPEHVFANGMMKRVFPYKCKLGTIDPPDRDGKWATASGNALVLSVTTTLSSDPPGPVGRDQSTAGYYYQG
jgi:hypothetical protein